MGVRPMRSVAWLALLAATPSTWVAGDEASDPAETTDATNSETGQEPWSTND